MKLLKRNIVLLGLSLIAGFFKASADAPYSLSDSGNAAYAKANYAKAADYYIRFLNSGYESPMVYYNLGNCYYRTNQFAKAILNYEKAKKLTPGDADIAFNLQMANLKTVDKITANDQLFLVNWWNAFVNMASEQGWAITAIVMLCLGLVLALAYFLSPNVMFKQLGFWGGGFFILCCILALLLSDVQYNAAQTHDTAIVMSATVTIKGAPTDNATQLFVIHEGAKVKVIKTEGNWVEVKLANGNQGWMMASDITSI